MVKLANMAILLLLIFSGLFFMAGCSATVAKDPVTSSPSAPSSLILEQMQRPALAVEAVQPLPAAVQQALMPSLFSSQQLGGSDEVEQRFDVGAENVEASAFFAGLVEGTATNMVVHPQVAGTVSLRLKNVTLAEVMAIVQDVYGYHYRTIAGGYQILPNNLQTRIFEVDYLTLQRSGTSSMKVSSGQVTDGANSSDSSSASNDSGRSSSGNDSGTGSQIETTSETDFWPAFQRALEALIGVEDGRKVIIQPQAGLVVVRALPSELDFVANYLQRTKSSLQRQVILETKIIEVQLNDGFQTGINWGSLIHNGTNLARIGQVGGGSSLSSGSSEISGSNGNLNPSAPTAINGLISSAFGGVFSAAVEFDDFQAFVEAVKTQGDVQVLSSPRISTLNNQKAVIKVGTDEFFVTDVSSDTDTETDTATADITLTPFFSGIALDVTPQISENGQVTLHIHPTVSDVEDQTKVITVNGQEQSLPLAFSSVRESDTIVSARNGQVVVIGGLMKNTETKKTAGVPILGDLPGVGYLFRQQQDSTRKTELIILLRPQVVNQDQDWATDVEQARQRMQQLL
ncbi:MAG: pilus (MSHA type) biogenesis protein MshL [Desulfobacteraceae bacterium 4572_35.2]|nr:MAG: pilus (MSHA type) biogenesis protein MshL [Desulfobacteraceae bacterium 4572_35.2]